MPWRGPCHRLMGWWAGNPPPGDDRGEREKCKGRDGHGVLWPARTLPTIIYPQKMNHQSFSDIVDFKCKW